MPPTASACGFEATTRRNAKSAKAAKILLALRPSRALRSVAGSEPIRVLAQAWNDQPSAVEPLQDRDDVQRENGDPAEHQENAQHAAEAERGEGDKARHQEPAEDQHQLRDHEDDAVLGVPLRFG